MSMLGLEEKLPTWIATTYREFGYYGQALQICIAANKLSPRQWRTLLCMALTYACQGLYVTAFEVMCEVANIFRSDPDARKKYEHIMFDEVFFSMAVWSKKIKDYDLALKSFEEIYDHNPRNYVCLFEIMSLLSEMERHFEIIEYLEDMKHEPTDTGLTRLVEMVHKNVRIPAFHQIISLAGKKTNNMRMVKYAYWAGLEAIKGTTHTLLALRFWYGTFLYYYSNSKEDQEEAILIWKLIVDAKCGIHAFRGVFQELKTEASNKLASIYLHRAKEAGLGTPTAEGYFAKLKELKELANKVLQNAYMSANDFTQLLLCRYYKLAGRDDMAREEIRAYIALGIDILSDDDASNDWQGYLGLSTAFFFYGDDQNALAGLSLLRPTTFDDEGEPVDEEEKSSKGLMCFSMTCDGICGLQRTFVSDFYYCRDCADVQFCRKCYEKLQESDSDSEPEGSISSTIFATCDKSHEFLYAPPWNKELADSIPEGHAKVGEEVIPVGQWIDRIKEQWKE